jgi:hypothetical protein
MTEQDLKNHIADLVKKFEAFSIRYLAASTEYHLADSSALSRTIYGIADALEDIPGDARRSLVPLLSHENLGVRYQAASHLSDIEDVLALRVLQSIADEPFGPLKGAAGMTVRHMTGKMNYLGPPTPQVREHIAKRERERDANRAAWLKRLGRA